MRFLDSDISKIIPHEDSFRFVDKIIDENEEEKSLIAMVSFSKHIKSFSGHYPQEEIVPGIIIIEALSQCSILCGYRFSPVPEAADKQIRHLTLEVQCRFKETIHYMDDVLLYSRIDKTVNEVSVFKVKAIDAKSNKVCASGQIMGIALALPSCINSKDEAAENH